MFESKKAKRFLYPTIKKVIFFVQLGLKPGRLFDCQFYHADAWVCMSQDQSKRKYDWIEYEDGRVLGKKDQCESKLRYLLSPYHLASKIILSFMLLTNIELIFSRQNKG